MDSKRERCFPRLTPKNYKVTSTATRNYNCLAHAVHREDVWFSHLPGDGRYWPPGVTRSGTVGAWIEALGHFAFVPCSSPVLELGVEKIAIYTKEDVPTHVARQLPSGHWTSKLGSWEQIEHKSLHDLEGDVYGTATHFLSHPRGSNAA